jgi:hypothetical protein
MAKGVLIKPDGLRRVEIAKMLRNEGLAPAGDADGGLQMRPDRDDRRAVLAEIDGLGDETRARVE